MSSARNTLLRIESFGGTRASVDLYDGRGSDTGHALFGLNWGAASFSANSSEGHDRLSGAVVFDSLPQVRQPSMGVRISGGNDGAQGVIDRQSRLEHVCAEIRRHGGRISWRANGQSSRQHLAVTAAALAPGPWLPRTEATARRDVTLNFTAATLATGDPMDVDIVLADRYATAEEMFDQEWLNALSYTTGRAFGPRGLSIESQEALGLEALWVGDDYRPQAVECRTRFIVGDGDEGNDEFYATILSAPDGVDSAGGGLAVILFGRPGVAAMDVYIATNYRNHSWSTGSGAQSGPTVDEHGAVEVAGYLNGSRVQWQVVVDGTTTEGTYTLADSEAARFSGSGVGGRQGFSMYPRTDTGAYVDRFRRYANAWHEDDGGDLIVRQVRPEIPGDEVARVDADLVVANVGPVNPWQFGLLATAPDLAWDRVWNGGLGYSSSAPTGWEDNLTWTGRIVHSGFGDATVDLGQSPPRGLYALQVDSSAQNKGVWSSLMGSFEQGVTYRAEAWVKGAVSNIQLHLGNGGDGTTDAATDSVAGDAEKWQLLTCDWVPDETTHDARVGFNQTSAGAATFYAAGVRVWEVSRGEPDIVDGDGAQGAPPCEVLDAGVFEELSQGGSVGFSLNEGLSDTRSGRELKATFSGSSIAVPAVVIRPDLVATDDNVESVAVELWQRVELDDDITSAVVTTSAVPATVTQTAPELFTIEHGSDGATITPPAASDEEWRLVRLGTIVFPVARDGSDPLAWVVKASWAISHSGSNSFAVDYTIAVPADRRVASPTGGDGTDHPAFLSAADGIRRITSEGGRRAGAFAYSPLPGRLALQSGPARVLALAASHIPNTTSEDSDDGEVQGGGLRLGVTPRYGQMSGRGRLPEGSVMVDALNYRSIASGGGDSWTLGTGTAGYSGEGYLEALADSGDTHAAAAGPEAQYRFVLDRAGTFYVWLRVLSDGAAGNTLWAGEAGSTPADYLQVGTTAGVWSWVGELQGGGRATITADTPGVVDLSVWAREDGVGVDRVILTPDETFIPADAMEEFASLS
jgi:hypothetical protein